MKRMLVIVVLAACGGGQKKEPPENTGGDKDTDRCAVVETRARSDMQADYPKDADAETMKMYQDMTAKAVAILGRHCRDDGWSDELLDCVEKSEDTQQCKSLLTPEQEKAIDDDMMKEMGARKKEED